jgi:hypothetical protein
MAMISIGDALGEGFGLIRRRPLTVLAWGAVRTLFTAGVFSLMAPVYVSMFSQMAARARGGVAPPPDMATVMQLQGASWLVSLAGGFVAIVLYCAVFRAVLHPEQRRFAYLRVGAAELFMAVLAVAFYIALFIAMFIVFIPVGIVIAITAAAHAPVIGVLLAVVVGIVSIVALFWLMFRLSLAGPMIVQDGKFHLFDAWALTRGHAGTLFLIVLCVVVILIVIEAVIGAVGIAVGVSFLGQAAGGLKNLPAFFSQPPATIISSLLPALIVAGLFSIPISGGALAIIGAPWARAYRDLAQPDLAATFS